MSKPTLILAAALSSAWLLTRQYNPSTFEQGQAVCFASGR